MKLYIGYPEKVREVTKALKVDDKKSFFENAISLSQAKTQYDVEHFSEPVRQGRVGHAFL